MCGKLLNLLWQFFYIIGQIFIALNGRKMKQILAIWSHWKEAMSVCVRARERERLFCVKAELCDRQMSLNGWKENKQRKTKHNQTPPRAHFSCPIHPLCSTLLCICVSYPNSLFFYKKNGPTPAIFCLFLVFSNKQYNFYNKSMWKNVQISI